MPIMLGRSPRKLTSSNSLIRWYFWRLDGGKELVVKSQAPCLKITWKLLVCVTLHLEELLQSNPSTYKLLNSSQHWATRVGENQLLRWWVKDSLGHSALGRSMLLDAWRDSLSRGAFEQSLHPLPDTILEGMTPTPPSAFRCGGKKGESKK